MLNYLYFAGFTCRNKSPLAIPANIYTSLQKQSIGTALKMTVEVRPENVFLKIFSLTSLNVHIPSRHLLFQNQNTRTMCETCSKLILKTPERRQ